jgi:integrase
MLDGLLAFTEINVRKKITKKLVDEIEPSDKPVFVFDVDQAGFVLKVTPTGHRTYQLRYRMGGRNTRVRTYTIARHGEMTPEQARRTAQALVGDIRRGIDPSLAKQKRTQEERGAITVELAAADFMELHTKSKRRPRTITEYDKLLRNVILPAFGNRRIMDMATADIERWHHAMKATPYQANRALAVLSKLMNWAQSRGHRQGDNPCKMVEKFKEIGRKRYLSLQEIGRVGEAIRDLEAAGQLSPHVAAFFRVVLLTGMRKNEIQLLEWQRVNFDRSVILLEDGLDDGDAKNGSRDVPISGPVRLILADLPRISGNPYVFVGKLKGRPIVNVSKPWARVLAAADIPGVRIHDLRHTAASIGVASGASLALIGGVLGHKSPQTTARYVHLSDDPVRAVSETIAERIGQALNATQAEIVPLRRT